MNKPQQDRLAGGRFATMPASSLQGPQIDRARSATLSPEARAEISEALRESRLERIAAETWSDAIDRGDYDEADRIAAETESWFEPD